MSKKNLFLFLLLLGVSFILMTYQSKKGHLLTAHGVSTLLHYSQAASRSATDSITSPLKTLSLRAKENILLRKRVDELLLERAKYQETVLENKRLRQLLDLRERQQRYVATARVLARGTDRWSHILVLDKGSSDGIAKDMCAITPGGLAGKIIEVTDAYAKVLLLTDITFSAAVRLQESRKEGIISGTGTKHLVLKYVPYEDAIKTGDIVITSGLDRLFPPGIPVGFVSKVKTQGRGHFQDIEVSPYVDESRIEEILIIQ